MGDLKKLPQLRLLSDLHEQKKRKSTDYRVKMKLKKQVLCIQVASELIGPNFNMNLTMLLPSYFSCEI